MSPVSREEILHGATDVLVATVLGGVAGQVLGSGGGEMAVEVGLHSGLLS
jgi:hypothetical protein